MLTPIETYYEGYRFRSRLEARWAVFFKEAGIQFEYEPQGFNLGFGAGAYLPDFYLPQFRAYVEIKPMSISDAAEREAKYKLRELFYESTARNPEEENENAPGIICLFCKGDPVECVPEIMCNECNDSGGGTTWWWEARFYKGADYYQDCDNGWLFTPDDCTTIAVGPKRKDSGYSDRTFSDSNWKECGLFESFTLSGYEDDLTAAKLAARRARFEHGERG